MSKKINIKKLQNIRWVVQLTSILLMLFIAKSGLQILGMTPTKTLAFMLIPIMIFLGPLWCGWFCPAGMFQRFTYIIGKKIFGKKHKSIISDNLHNKLKYLKFVILAVYLITFLLGKLSIISPSIAKTIDTSSALVLLSVLIFSLFTERIYCNYLCLMGAEYGLLNLIRLKPIKRDEENCVSCKMCSKACPMKIDVAEKQKIRDARCISCYKCISSCPKPGVLKI